MFFFTGLLFWARVIDPGPLRPRLEWPARIAYVVGAMVVGWVLAITLVLVQHPLYSHYALLAHRPGGISALTDQQLAAGVMWVPGSISYTILMILGVYRWLEPDTKPASAPRGAHHLGGLISAMLPLFFADGFLAGSVLTLLLPIGLLIAIAVWYVRTLRRLPAGHAGRVSGAAILRRARRGRPGSRGHPRYPAGRRRLMETAADKPQGAPRSRLAAGPGRGGPRRPRRRPRRAPPAHRPAQRGDDDAPPCPSRARRHGRQAPGRPRRSRPCATRAVTASRWASLHGQTVAVVFFDSHCHSGVPAGRTSARRRGAVAGTGAAAGPHRRQRQSARHPRQHPRGGRGLGLDRPRALALAEGNPPATRVGVEGLRHRRQARAR